MNAALSPALAIAVALAGCNDTGPASGAPDAAGMADAGAPDGGAEASKEIVPSDPASIGAFGALGTLVVLDEVLLHTALDADAAAVMGLAREVSGEVVGHAPELGLWQIRLRTADAAALEAALSRASASPVVQGAFPNGVLLPLSEPVYPDDGDAWPDLRNQAWGQRAVGLPEAWALTTGEADQAPVAVVDEGVNVDHRDFSGRGERRFGHSLRNGHGTHVAGILGATGDNGMDVAGVNWQAPLYFYEINGFLWNDENRRRLDDALRGLLDALGMPAEVTATDGLALQAVARAAAEARVINFSYGTMWRAGGRRICPSRGGGLDAWLEDQRALWRPTMDVVRAHDALVVAAAGNESDAQRPDCLVDARLTGGPLLFNERDDYRDHVLVVAAVGSPLGAATHFDEWSGEWHALWGHSSAGDLIDVAAPGAMILSLCQRFGFYCSDGATVRYLSGTSMAAPFVAGVASLALALRRDLSAAALKEKIVLGARRAGPRVYRPLGGEAVETLDFHVLHAAETLRIIERAPGCRDEDGDGFGAPDDAGAAGLDCREAAPDCDDGDPSARPGGVELCDGLDNDCNSHVDEEGVCQGELADAPVSGVVPGVFDTDGGEFRLSVSPLDPNGDLVHRTLTERSFTFHDIEVERLDRPGEVVTRGTATATEIEVHLPDDGREALRLLLLFDSSGSMAENDAGYLRVRAAGELLRRLDAADEVAVMDFGAGGGGTTRLLAPMSADRAATEAGLAQVTADGGTPMFQAVIEAADYLSGLAGGRAVLVLLSDGQANDDDLPFAPRAVEAAQRARVTVFAVGLGQNLDFANLETLTDGTGGTFAFARDADVLTRLFDAVGVAAAQGRIVVHGAGRFDAPLAPARHLVRGVLRTALGGASVDTPFDFTVMVRAE